MRHSGNGPRRVGHLVLLTVGMAALCSCNSVSDTDRIRILRAEDHRAPEGSDLQLIRSGLRSRDAGLRRLSVRALGRLERPELAGDIAPLLQDPDPVVRTTAAWSLAQAVGGADPEPVVDILVATLHSDPDPRVRAAAAVSLGRLPHGTEAAVAAAEEALMGASFGETATQLGVARALDSLLRGNRSHQLTQQTIDRLEALVLLNGEAAESERIRALALSALDRAGQLEIETAAIALADPATEVRRLATSALVRLPESPRRRELMSLAASDPSAQVRYASLASPAAAPVLGAACDRLRSALQDPDVHVRLRAIDLLDPCAGATRLLTELVEPLEASDERGWHVAARALVALARADPAGFAKPAAAGLDHPVWQVRMYTARAAGTAQAASVLEALALDAHPNVRTAALRGLQVVRGHEADAWFRQALASDDYQLLIAAAEALQGSPDPEPAIPELLDALARVSRHQRETSRDARSGLLERIAELGTAQQADALVPYLNDFDPRLAELAAETLATWSGKPQAPAAQPLPPLPFPSLALLQELAGARVTVQMANGGDFELRLLPFDAPTNSARFARLARAGYFDGLTFHRVVPNFVIQGGSPGANEFAGDGPYTRDELTSRSHVRGTVGISTRGRDTGDAQIFINLVDNMRLDHEYTIFAEVVEGMDTVDAILEGAVIDTVTVGGGARRRLRTPLQGSTEESTRLERGLTVVTESILTVRSVPVGVWNTHGRGGSW